MIFGLAAGPVRADPAPTPDVTGAPLPGHESGRVDGGQPATSSSAGRAIASGVLFVPRVIVEGLLLPVRGGVWLYDRYQLRDLYYRTFYNRDRTFGIVPVIVYQTGYGLMGGARLIDTNLFGDQEHLTIEGAAGGSYQVRAAAWLDSGNRLGPVILRLGGNFDRFRKLPFYGIGNADLSPSGPVRVDPITSPDFAHKTFYRYQEARVELAAGWRIADGLHLIGRGAFADLEYGPGQSGVPINDVFDPVGLVGFVQGVQHVYGEAELRWDTRHIASPAWELSPITTGWLVSGFAGRVHNFEAGGDFTHYGIDLQYFLHLGLAPHMLVFRVLGEGVTGDLDEVPFSELPYLGGDILRGYDFARFRDRVSAVGTAQYQWDLSRYTDAFLFVDGGRVFHSLDDLTFDDFRVGFGVGISAHSESGFLITGTLAGSVDGDVFVTAILAPLWNERPRWR